MSRTANARAERLARIAAHGVVGAGGAGFPTHVKLAAPAECIILNAAECEPLLHKDKEILRHFPGEVLDGLRSAAELVGARDIVVGVKGKYADVIERLTPLLPENGRIVPLTDSYPSGDEFILVYDVTKKIIPPGGLPRDVGCVVVNVETALNIARDTPVIETFLTVAGAVREPCTLRVPVGISQRDAIDLAGGATVADPHVLSGGAMMGRLVPLAEPITKTCGGLLVLPPEHFLIRHYQQDWKQIARIGASACDQCSFCTEFCPRYLLGHPLEPHRAMRSLGFTEDREPNVLGTQFCCECNLCTLMACPEDLDPKSVCVHNKRQLASAGSKWPVAAHPYRAELHLANRRVPIGRLILKLGLGSFSNEGPLHERLCSPARVRLPLKQHSGVPAVPVVRDGAHVQPGELLARPPADALGATVHASIAGVCRVTAGEIAIESTPAGVAR